MENLEKMQNIILKSQDISAYLTPVDERLKREERPEYRYFFALLQEQLIMMMEGKKDFNLENVLRKIYGTEYTPVQAVRAALELLLSTERLQLFEADAIRNAAGNGILRLAAREPEAFANNDVAASYQLLKEDTARELNLGRFLNRLDDEWKSIYCKRYGGRVSRREYRESYDRPEQRRPYPGSARTRYELDEDEEMDEEDESSPIILIIAAVVALLVGVAISLVLCILVPDKITMAISIGLILVGITGDIVIIIHNIIASKRRERYRTVYSIQIKKGGRVWQSSADFVEENCGPDQSDSVRAVAQICLAEITRPPRIMEMDGGSHPMTRESGDARLQAVRDTGDHRREVAREIKTGSQKMFRITGPHSRKMFRIAGLHNRKIIRITGVHRQKIIRITGVHSWKVLRITVANSHRKARKYIISLPKADPGTINSGRSMYRETGISREIRVRQEWIRTARTSRWQTRESILRSQQKARQIKKL